MRLIDKSLAALTLTAAFTLTASFASTAFGATITGNVQGPDGKPFMGAFVVAENIQNRMTVSVLSDAQGRYHIGNLPAATYRVQIATIGYKSDPRTDVRLTDDEKASFDFALQKRPVRWSELNTYQGRQLLPKTASHDLSHDDNFFTTCFQSCHSFQKRMASSAWDEDGWRDRVKYMRDVMLAGEGRRMSDETLEDFTAYLTTAFGPDSPKTESPEDMPQYKSLVRPFSPRAMNIAYVEYDFAAPKGLGPWSAVEDKDGKFWIPYYGRGNEVVRLDPKTAELTRFALPFAKAAGIHSGSSGRRRYRLVHGNGCWARSPRLDPRTKQITEYQNSPLPDGRRTGTAHGFGWITSAACGRAAAPRLRCSIPRPKSSSISTSAEPTATSSARTAISGLLRSARTARSAESRKMASCPNSIRPPRASPSDSKWMPTASSGSPSAEATRSARLDPKTGTIKEFPLPGPEAKSTPSASIQIT